MVQLPDSSKRRPLVAGNWKMNGTLEEASALTRELLQSLPGSTLRGTQCPMTVPGSVPGLILAPPSAPQGADTARKGNAPSLEVEVALCPPFTALHKVAELIRGTPVRLGAQDVHWETKGAYTGEVSPAMLREIGCHYCIIGHSERRQHFGETDAAVRRKVTAVLAQGLGAILCIGETREIRQRGQTWEVVEQQLRAGLEGVAPQEAAAHLVVAYEPVWAIGTGLNATPQQAQEVHARIRDWLKQRFSPVVAQQIRIQYGGSVKPDNAQELMAQPDVDGALVGGASLDARQFVPIVEAALHAKEAKCSTR